MTDLPGDLARAGKRDSVPGIRLCIFRGARTARAVRIAQSEKAVNRAARDVNARPLAGAEFSPAGRCE